MAYGYNSQGQVIYYPDTDHAPGGDAIIFEGPNKNAEYGPNGWRSRDANVWESLYGKLPAGKKYDSNGNVVNTTAWEKFDTGFGNAMKWGGIGLGVGAGGALLGGALAGAYGGGALAAAPAASSSAGTLGAASTPGLIAAGTTAVPGTIVGSGAGLGAGFGGAAFGAAPTLASSSIGGLGVGSTSVPATVTGSGGAATGGGGTASTVGQTLVKKAGQKAAQTAAQKAAKKWMTAGAVVAPAVAGLYAATRGKSGQPNDINQALSSLLAQQTEQMNQEQPLRRLLLSQQAGMLPSYMKQDPGYQQWLQSSAPSAAQGAMSAVARPRFA